MEPMAVSTRMHFAGFTLDMAQRTLRHGTKQIELRSKSFDVLCYLLERRGNLATKDEICRVVWPNVIATDDSLTRCVSDIRRTLQDSDQRIIKTVPGRGYIFSAPVSITEFNGIRLPRWKKIKSWAATKRNFVVVAFLMMIVAGWITAGAGVFRDRQSPNLTLPDRPSVAVLPFVNMSGGENQDYLGDGIADDLAANLSKFGELFVIASNSAGRYKGLPINVQLVGRELSVRYLVQGNVWKRHENVHISVRLLATNSGEEIWGDRYVSHQSSVFFVQDEITKHIVIRLASQIGRSELKRAKTKPPKTWSAYEHYLRGNALLKLAHRDPSGSAIAAAKSAYNKAIAIDQEYAPAIGGLASVQLTDWLSQHVISSPSASLGRKRAHAFDRSGSLDEAERLARNAIELDPGLAEGYAVLAWVLHWKVGPTAAVRMFERAFELNPNLANGRYANSLAHSGRASEAVAFLKRVMRLDPFYPPIYEYFLGKSYFYAGQYQESLERLRAVAGTFSGLKPVLPIYAAVAAQTGNTDEAREVATKLLQIQPDFSVARFLRSVRLVRREDRERLAQGLTMAGLPK